MPGDSLSSLGKRSAERRLENIIAGRRALFSPAGSYHGVRKLTGDLPWAGIHLVKPANREGQAMHAGNGRFVKRSDQPVHHDLRVLKAVSLKMARRWCSSPEQAEDIAQEALLRFLVCRRQVQKPNAWFYLVTRRLAARASSRISRQAEVERISLTLRPSLSDSPEFFVDVKTILGMLPVRDRKLLELAVSGTSHREFATHFRCQVRDVGQMLARAQRKARRARDAHLRADRPINKFTGPVIKRRRRES